MMALSFLFGNGHTVKLAFALTILCGFFLTGCAVVADAEPEPIVDDEDASQGLLLTVYTGDGATLHESFFSLYESEHAIALVSAHSISEKDAKALLDSFERDIFPASPSSKMLDEAKLPILLTFMEGNVRGYAAFSEDEDKPSVCLNVLYPEALTYALAHEYQHVCLHEACATGGVSMSEDLDEQLSNVFCEMVFPGKGEELGILSTKKALDMRGIIDRAGKDMLKNVYALVRAGYSEDEIRSWINNR